MDILDMCCGYGRHSFEFSNFGHTVLGIDYSQVLINLAKEKLKNNKIKNIDFAVEDIRYFNTLKKFDLVVCLFVSLGYFNNTDNEIALNNLCKSVKENGYLVLELYNNKNIKNRSNNSKYIQTKRWYSPKSNRVFIKRTINNGTENKTYTMQIYVYSLYEIEKISQKFGLKIVKVFGNYDGEIYNDNSDNMIVFLKKENHNEHN